jgi:OmpA-OmpF porin, OOP family
MSEPDRTEINQVVEKFKAQGLRLALCLKLTLWLCIGSVSIAAAQERQRHSEIVPLGEVFNQASGVATGQSRIIFYRPLSNSAQGAATVLINNQYHASLTAGGFSEICLSPGSVELGMRWMDVNRRPNKDGADITTVMEIKNGTTHFLKAVGRGRQLMLRPVDAQIALSELGSTRDQIHTISRVKGAQKCREVSASEWHPTAAHSPSQVQQFQLAGDTLFKFDRSDLAGLTHQGIEALHVLQQRIQMSYSRIDRIHVIGHADPLGNPNYNDRLSENRALTVRYYLESNRALNGRITTEGRGSRELVVNHCGFIRSVQSIACHLPNRRVTVEVTGQRQ